MTQTMAHTCYRVADLKKSVKFYTSAFDFEVSRERDFPEYKFTLVLHYLVQIMNLSLLITMIMVLMS